MLAPITNRDLIIGRLIRQLFQDLRLIFRPERFDLVH